MRTRSSPGNREDNPDTERLIARCSAEVLSANYDAIQKLARGKWLLPMIKANAYGHGAAWAAAELYRKPDLYALGVATLAEGREVREAVGLRGRKTRVIVFSGALPWTEEKGRFCEEFDLVPVIASDEDWAAFYKGGWPSRLAYELKFNTGMNRLGISFDRLQQVRAQVAKLAADQRPSGVLTHLACAEDPKNERTLSQVQKFRQIRAELEAVVPNAQFHVANSSAIWNLSKLGLEELTDGVRPGISLYGVVPWAGAPARGVSPVMEIQARVLAIRNLQAGEGMGYGFSHIVSRAQGSDRVAIIGCGYADGLPRALSNQGRYRGVISMDLSAVACGGEIKAGDWVRVMGEGIDIWEQAQLAGTLPYELLTSVGARVQRVYV